MNYIPTSNYVPQPMRPCVYEGGIYKHFKGGLYVVLAILKSSEDPEDESKELIGYMNLMSGERYWRSYRSTEDGFVTPKKHPSGEEQDRFMYWGMANEVKLTGGSYFVTHQL